MSMFKVIDGMTQEGWMDESSEWELLATDNQGLTTSLVLLAEDGVSDCNPENYAQCITIIRTALKPGPDLHMIIIKKDGRDFQRWDREPVRGGNNWIEIEDIDSTIKVIGPIRELNLVNSH